MRAEGYYWVKHDGSWVVAKFYIHDELSPWSLMGMDFKESYFDEIDEKQILRGEL